VEIISKENPGVTPCKAEASEDVGTGKRGNSVDSCRGAEEEAGELQRNPQTSDSKNNPPPHDGELVRQLQGILLHGALGRSGADLELMREGLVSEAPAREVVHGQK